MDEPEVFRNALGEAGFDADRFFALIESRNLKDELVRNT
jgi:hypothetical protein